LSSSSDSDIEEVELTEDPPEGEGIITRKTGEFDTTNAALRQDLTNHLIRSGLDVRHTVGDNTRRLLRIFLACAYLTCAFLTCAPFLYLPQSPLTLGEQIKVVSKNPMASIFNSVIRNPFYLDNCKNFFKHCITAAVDGRKGDTRMFDSAICASGVDIPSLEDFRALDRTEELTVALRAAIECMALLVKRVTKRSGSLAPTAKQPERFHKLCVIATEMVGTD